MRAQSSPNSTPRTATLLAAALDQIRDGDTVVDLGAGRDAGVALAVKRARPACRVFAVEPLVEVSVPRESGIEVVAGFLDDLPAVAVDTILFNSPNTPDRFLDPDDGSWHQFAGGPRGFECLHDVVAAALRRVGSDGHVIFICPTFSPPPPDARLRLLAYYAEPRQPFLARAPVRESLRAEYAQWLAGRCAELASAWRELGVENDPAGVTAAVLAATAADASTPTRS